jgi:hypothetical protein
MSKYRSAITLLRTCFNSQTALDVSHRNCKQVFSFVGSKLVDSFKTCEILGYRACRFGYFLVFPTSSTSGGGRLSQGGKEKFVTRLAFRRARGQRRNEQAQPSLKAYRVEFIGPLTEYPGTENGRGEHKKSPIEFVLVL